jgi:integrase
MLDLGWQDGHRLRKTIRGESKRAVADRLARLRTDRQQGVVPPTDERTSVATFMTAWLQDARRSLRPTTYVSYEGHVRLHIVPRLGRLRLTQLQPQHVRVLLEAVQASGRSARTAQLTHAVLRRALGQAARDGLVARNVAALVQGPRVRRDEVRPFDPQEARAFLAAVQGDRLEALYTVAIALGLRQGEALGLTWDDVDLEAGRLSVRGSLQRVPTLLREDDAGRGSRYRLVEPKTARSRRTLVLPRIVVDALREHRKRQLEERLWAGSRWSAVWDLVFTTTIGTPLDARNVSHAFTALLARAGLRRIRFHDLRHSAATLMLAQGVPARVIMETLGHSQIGMTMNLYAHVIPTLQQEAADRLDALLAATE